MANILGLLTVNEVEVLQVDADPSAGAGTPAPQGSIAMYQGGTLYIKTGALDTDWQMVQAGSAGANQFLSNLLSLLPNANQALDLGSASFQWATLHVDFIKSGAALNIDVYNQLLYAADGVASIDYGQRALFLAGNNVFDWHTAGVLDAKSNLISNVLNPVSPQDAATKAYVDTSISGLSSVYLALAGGTMTGAINMGGHQINNMADPTLAQDAATKAYVDSVSGNFANKALSNLTAPTAINQDIRPGVGNSLNLGASGFAWQNIYVNSEILDSGNLPLLDAINRSLKDSSAVDSVQFQSRILADPAGLPMLGWSASYIDAHSHLISNVLDPVSPQDAVTLSYLSTQLGAYLPLAGGTMSGAIDMGSHQIHNVVDPTSAQDAATKNYVDGAISGLSSVYLKLTGGTMSGDIDMNGNYLQNVAALYISAPVSSSNVENINLVGTNGTVNDSKLVYNFGTTDAGPLTSAAVSIPAGNTSLLKFKFVGRVSAGPDIGKGVSFIRTMEASNQAGVAQIDSPVQTDFTYAFDPSQSVSFSASATQINFTLPAAPAGDSIDWAMFVEQTSIN